MRARYPRHLPRVWLMTDERMGEGLWDALRRLPRGGGVVFRHHATPEPERARLQARIAATAKARGLVVLNAGRPTARADGIHGRAARRSHGLLSRPVHSRREAVAAKRAGADLIFVSPVFSTRSHPGARVLGPVGAALLLRGIGIPAIALGGVDARRFRRLAALGLYGWAAIDAWTNQKRNAVPT